MKPNPYRCYLAIRKRDGEPVAFNTNLRELEDEYPKQTFLHARFERAGSTVWVAKRRPKPKAA